ncbi:MAG: hypothetical protein HY961_01975 [Ignavibacteriae bacterium]|nr:hypothetical protein [Ignavibacteriota bacterium]
MHEAKKMYRKQKSQRPPPALLHMKAGRLRCKTLRVEKNPEPLSGEGYGMHEAKKMYRKQKSQRPFAEKTLRV